MRRRRKGSRQIVENTSFWKGEGREHGCRKGSVGNVGHRSLAKISLTSMRPAVGTDISQSNHIDLLQPLHKAGKP